MLSERKMFLWGLAAGVTLTMLTLNLWGTWLEQKRRAGAQPTILAPAAALGMLSHRTFADLKLPAPHFLPEVSGASHENWKLKSLDGHALKLSDLKGRAVFLNFWSTTCAPCIAEMPNIARLAKSLQNEKVAFLAVTQDDDSQLREFLRTNSIDIPVYRAGKERPEDFSEIGVPVTYLLDAESRLIYAEVGARNWDTNEARNLLQRLAGTP
jgi:thiol-disulfide isomerase/thioredoxin